MDKDRCREPGCLKYKAYGKDHCYRHDKSVRPESEDADVTNLTAGRRIYKGGRPRNNTNSAQYIGIPEGRASDKDVVVKALAESVGRPVPLPTLCRKTRLNTVSVEIALARLSSKSYAACTDDGWQLVYDSGRKLSFGTYLTALRRNKGWNVLGAGIAIGMSSAKLTSYERGSVGRPGLVVLSRLAAAYDVAVLDMVKQAGYFPASLHLAAEADELEAAIR